jgi:hypothetical protein
MVGLGVALLRAYATNVGASSPFEWFLDLDDEFGRDQGAIR